MNIYVGNLDFGVNDADLKEAFEAHGAVDSARVIIDRQTGRSRGFGFVEMPEESEAKAAIEEMDGADIKGRSVKVNEARPKEDRGSGGGGGGRNRYGGGGGGGRNRW
jgi:RNA recognition motif-containing protein